MCSSLDIWNMNFSLHSGCLPSPMNLEVYSFSFLFNYNSMYGVEDFQLLFRQTFILFIITSNYIGPLRISGTVSIFNRILFYAHGFYKDTASNHYKSMNNYPTLFPLKSNSIFISPDPLISLIFFISKEQLPINSFFPLLS